MGPRGPRQELWQRAVLGAAIVGSSPEALQSGLAAMRRLVEENPRCQILSWEGRVSAFDDAGWMAGESVANSGPSARESSGEPDPAPEWYETEPDDETFGGDWKRFRDQAKAGSEDGPEEGGADAEAGDGCAEDPDSR